MFTSVAGVRRRRRASSVANRNWNLASANSNNGLVAAQAA